jgi:hypothetical protein
MKLRVPSRRETWTRSCGEGRGNGVCSGPTSGSLNLKLPCGESCDSSDLSALKLVKHSSGFTVHSTGYEKKGNEKKEIEKGSISKQFMILRNCLKYCFPTSNSMFLTWCHKIFSRGPCARTKHTFLLVLIRKRLEKYVF